MKSSFLLTLALSALVTTVASAQVTSKKTPGKRRVVNKKTATIAPKKVDPPVVLESKSGFNKFYDRLKISYFGALSTPTLRDMKDGHWTNAAVSPQWDLEEDSGKLHDRNRDTVPTNIYHQFSFNYNYGGTMNFVINPRLSTQLAESVSMNRPEDRGVIVVEDFLVGFQGVVASSSDKKLNLWMRPGVRLPTSRASRDSNSGGDGKITYQLDLSYSLTYDFSKTLQVGVSGQWRQWVIEDNYSFRRVRLSTSPFIQYNLDDKSNLQFHYENSLETDSRGAGKTNVLFRDFWQNAMIGYARDVAPKLNIMPFIACFVDDAPITDQSFWGGAQVTYSFK